MGGQFGMSFEKTKNLFLISAILFSLIRFGSKEEAVEQWDIKPNQKLDLIFTPANNVAFLR